MRRKNNKTHRKETNNTAKTTNETARQTSTPTILTKENKTKRETTTATLEGRNQDRAAQEEGRTRENRERANTILWVCWRLPANSLRERSQRHPTNERRLLLHPPNKSFSTRPHYPIQTTTKLSISPWSRTVLYPTATIHYLSHQQKFTTL